MSAMQIFASYVNDIDVYNRLLVLRPTLSTVRHPLAGFVVRVADCRSQWKASVACNERIASWFLLCLELRPDDLDWSHLAVEWFAFRVR